MAQIIEVPGVGEVEFPDTMSDAEIVAAVRKLSATSPEAMSSHGSTPVYEPPKPTRTESGLRGLLQGLTAGTGDEMAGVGRAFGSMRRPREATPQTMGQYRDSRDAERVANAAAEEANPGTYLAGQVTGGTLPTLLGGAPATGLRAMGIAAGQGALQGAGYSEHEGRRLVGDTALGAGLGLLGYGTGQVLGKGATAAVRKGRDLVRTGTARAGTQAAGEVADELATAAGKLGGEVQKGSRQVENLMRLEASMTPQQRALYDSLVAQGIVPDLQQAVAQSTLESLPQQAASIATRKAELAALQSAAPQTAAARAQALLTPQPKADIKSFLKAYAEPMAWAVGGQQLGQALGLDPAAQGALAGAAGLVGGRTRAGKALYTRLTRPAHQVALGQRLERVGQAGQSQIAEILRRALAAGAPAAGTAALVEE